MESLQVGILCTYEVFKRRQLLNVLTRFCKLYLESGKIPSEWRKSIICSIYKEKDLEKRLPSSYRGISLVSCFYKIYRVVLNNRVMLFLECDNKLVDEQNGFRHGRSCEDHLFIISSIIRNNLSEKKVFMQHL